MDQREISGFYDDFAPQQVQTGANERLVSLYRRLRDLGLRRNSNVLELGCGVGVFTKLIAGTVTSGTIEAVDLSEKSIAIARELLKGKSNVRFAASDVVHYPPKTEAFHFITLMDVIEHIPLGDHPALFSRIASYASEETLICINIPNPAYIEYVKKHHPAGLQIIDQPVHLQPLLEVLEGKALELIFFEKYSIWQREDYHFMVLRKERAFEPELRSASYSFAEKLGHKIRRTADRIRFR
jgi:SAM-dependent methyltransferase